MAGKVVILRDEQGLEHGVEVNESGTAAIDGRTLRVAYGRRGEIRVDERTVWVASSGDARWTFIDGHVHVFEVDAPAVAIRSNTTAAAPSRRSRGHRDGALAAPMPATVVKIAIAPGDHVKAGDSLIILEAMKMELPVRAPIDGQIKAVRCTVGQLVQPGEELVELEAGPTSPA
jgi:biotin carboxyl carrier protein